MRVAWFSPLPPVRSGIAAYSAELLPLLQNSFVIDSYPEATAHDFVWQHRRAPYDLVVYQLGNAACHDYMWAYLVRYPGLVVLHDAKLHHARARQLLQQRRADDYRREFAYDHPDTRRDASEYAVVGLGGSIQYLWRMVRVVMRTARLIAVHSPLVSEDLRDEYPATRIATIRMGVPALEPSSDGRAAIRKQWDIPQTALAFAAFGKVTAEKRIPAILDALATVVAEGRNAYLLLVGDADDYVTLEQQLQSHGVANRVRITGYVRDEDVADYLAAADACLCLRWPTTQESSASWLRCLSARRATVLTDLAHLADIPEAVALRVDLLDERRTLTNAMRALSDDVSLRERVGRAGHDYWKANHTLESMADDYRRLLRDAAAMSAPAPEDLPKHFYADHSEVVNTIAAQFDVAIDFLQSHNTKPRNDQATKPIQS